MGPGRLEETVGPSPIWALECGQVKIVTKPSDAWEFIGATGCLLACPSFRAAARRRRTNSRCVVTLCGQISQPAVAKRQRTMPLHKNKKGKGWFWGGDWSESFVSSCML